jgi:hypothetical protein
MKAVLFEVIFSLEARTLGSENKGALILLILPLAILLILFSLNNLRPRSLISPAHW